MKPMKATVNRDALFIVLVRPRFPENVGSAARAMKNMGLGRLILVDGCSPVHPNAYRLASGAEDILERAEEVPSLRDATAELGFVVGTTCRSSKERSPLLTPRAAVRRLIPISRNNTIGLVFGSEKEGLRNEELSLCQLFVKIPSSGVFPSLNLAQSVMVLCYEIFRSSSTITEDGGELAASGHLQAMFEQMERTLIDIGFLDTQHPERIMRVLRKLFGRSRMNEREVRILRGIWSQVDRLHRTSKATR